MDYFEYIVPMNRSYKHRKPLTFRLGNRIPADNPMYVLK